MMREDPELGIVRLCRACGEEWPFDSEFWHLRNGKMDDRWPWRCIACCVEYKAARHRIRQEISRDRRRTPPALPGRCNARMRYGRCGRTAGHGYTHRDYRVMQDEAFRRKERRRAA